MPEDTCGHETADGTPCQHPTTDEGDPDRCWVDGHNEEAVPDDQQPGRDSKLTKAREEQIASAIEDGKSITSAARMAGINKTTLYRWMERGEDEENTVYAEFHNRIVRARGHGEDFYVRALTEIAKEEGDTATLMSMLKQQYPEEWGDVNRGEQAAGVVVNVGEAEEYEVDEETLEVTEQ